jgi:hypothetical protein
MRPIEKDVGMRTSLIRVGGYVATDRDHTNLRDDVWSFALDQRAFGPRRLVVAFADADGGFRGLAYARRTDPPEAALAPCIQHLGRGAAAAIAYCDEPVDDGPPAEDLGARFRVARAIAASYGVQLVDWIACDDQMFRSSQLALYPGAPWWQIA